MIISKILKKLQSQISEEKMQKTKTKINFTYTDGYDVTRSGPSQIFNLRTPLKLTIPSGAKVKFDVGVRCSHPLYVFQSRILSERGLSFEDGALACYDANTPLVLRLENKGKETIMLEDGETIVKAAVLDNSHLVTE